MKSYAVEICENPQSEVNMKVLKVSVALRD